MSISPWAMLMTRITPKVMARPSAVRIRMELKLIALNRASEKSVAVIGPSHGAARGYAHSRKRHLTLLPDLHLLAFDQPALGPVAAPAGERDLRERVRGDGFGGGVDDVELLVVAGLAHAEELVGVLLLRVELAPPAGGVEL